ncbi:Os04g0298066 [Oryza sativa Japonica Group]|uniref:Os04g0298066 protein n=1 Tax=Oryza sativa subsp. japonica TaxID=39947 RepID=A0A0P0W8A0_ORYSJ|nr:hypothetical protein EE612_022942 [Oryza sativa]BAS88453.1 Os04g0298066 [Oryza sativa Japonica Group]
MWLCAAYVVYWFLFGMLGKEFCRELTCTLVYMHGLNLQSMACIISDFAAVHRGAAVPAAAAGVARHVRGADAQGQGVPRPAAGERAPLPALHPPRAPGATPAAPASASAPGSSSCSSCSSSRSRPSPPSSTSCLSPGSRTTRSRARTFSSASRRCAAAAPPGRPAVAPPLRRCPPIRAVPRRPPSPTVGRTAVRADRAVHCLPRTAVRHAMLRRLGRLHDRAALVFSISAIASAPAPRAAPPPAAAHPRRPRLSACG